MSVQVAIIGAGVSGLYAASVLEKAGVTYTLIEGRQITGGRVMSCDVQASQENTAAHGAMRVDLGATWVWPSLQPQLAHLLNELGILLIPQNETGNMLFERAQDTRPSKHPGYVSSPSSVRIAGGMSLLIERLQQQISPSHLHTDRRVTRIEHAGRHSVIRAESSSGDPFTFTAENILLALPPALSAAIEFAPPLPSSLHHQWANTGTWMAPHAKYAAVYSRNFWREDRLSGEARSGIGPMVEIHDASVPGGICALFGFIGVPANTRWTTSDAALMTLCREQLVRLFGDAAAQPVAEFFKDWACDPFTATESDLWLNAGHSVPRAAPAEGPWLHRVRGIASEWSPMFPGYLAGAIDAATEGVRSYTDALSPPHHSMKAPSPSF